MLMASRGTSFAPPISICFALPNAMSRMTSNTGRSAVSRSAAASACGRTGIPDWSFYVAFSMFRLSAIAQGIMGRVLAGTANDTNARARGERARPMAEAGWAIAEARAPRDGTR